MLSATIFSDFRIAVNEQQLGVYGIHLWQRGEELTHRWRSDDEVALYSGSKTFTAVACGICQDEGRLNINDYWLEYFPEMKESAFPGTERQTLRDLLHMQSGKWGIPASMRNGSEDMLRAWAAEPLIDEPGTYFRYVNMCTYTIGRVIEKVSGKTLRDYLMPRLFLPLGILNPQWHTDALGHTLASTGLYLHTDEFARIGRLLLQGGVWDDRQIVSAEYASAMHEDVIDNSHEADPEAKAGYGYQVWRCTSPGLYRADGAYGQFSIVIPEREAVVTVTSHNERCQNDIVRAVEKEILPRL